MADQSTFKLVFETGVPLAGLVAGAIDGWRCGWLLLGLPLTLAVLAIFFPFPGLTNSREIEIAIAAGLSAVIYVPAYAVSWVLVRILVARRKRETRRR